MEQLREKGQQIPAEGHEFRLQNLGKWHGLPLKMGHAANQRKYTVKTCKETSSLQHEA